MIKPSRIYLLSLILIVLPAITNAAQLTGNPSNYRSVISTLTPGSVLQLETGTYTDGLPIINMHGEAGLPIEITGPTQGDPAVFTGNPCCNTIQIQDSSYIVISNLRIDGNNISGIDAVNGRGITHNITVSNLTIVGHAPDQGTIGISTKGPAWDWLIKDNNILEAGTGMYLGNSDGGLPFVRGIIENNVVLDTIGYNIEIKHQLPRPTDIGMPNGVNKTIIRNNVFSKLNNASSGNMARPNLLVGHAPDTGEGKDDYYEIYGNFFYQNPSEVLFQGEGNIAFYNNVLVNDYGAAVNIVPHNGVPKKVDVFLNTIVASAYGLRIQGGATEYVQQAIGNAVFAAASVVAPVSQNNIYDTYQASVNYLKAPLAPIDTLDLYPIAGKLSGPKIDIALFGAYTDANLDFNGNNRGGDFRGAYAGEGVNPGWVLTLTKKPRNSPSPTPAPTITFDVSPQAIPVNGSVTVSWNVTNADGCIASGHPDWVGVKTTTNSSGDVVGPITENVTLKLTCSNGGVTAEATADVVVTQPDQIPPVIANVDVVENGQAVVVFFNEAVDASSAENTANYAINNGINVLGAQLQNDLSSVKLTISQLESDTVYTLTVNNILDLAVSPNKIADETKYNFEYLVSDLVINNTLPSNYIWDTLDDGKLVYLDRDYVFTSVADKYRGLNYLRTANDDKSSSGDGFVTFAVNKTVEVFVGYDPRNVALPSWLQSWSDTGENMFSTDMPLHLYKKEFLAGSIQLGGNEMGNSMYIVVIGEAGGSPNSGNPGDQSGSPDTQNAGGGGLSVFALVVLSVLSLSASRNKKTAV